jgi:Glycosyltransferase family 87
VTQHKPADGHAALSTPPRSTRVSAPSIRSGDASAVFLGTWFESRVESLKSWPLGTKLLALWAVLVGVFQAITLPTYVINMALRATDFQSFHRAGAWVFGSQRTPLYPLTSFTGFSGPPADLHLCMNPPHFILALSPLAQLPMRTAYLLFCVANLAFLAATLFVMRPFLKTWGNGQRFCAAVLFFGFPFVTSAITQGTVSLLITLCLAVVITRDLQERTVSWRGALLPGFCLSLISMKPQYLILAGVYLLARRKWKVLFVGVGATAAWVVASIAFMGVEPWLHYPRYLQIFTQQLDVFDRTDPQYRWVAEQMINARGVLIRVLGFSQAGLINALSTALLLLAVGMTAALGLRVRRSTLNPIVAWGLVVLLTVCTSGHANPTDGVTLIIPAVLGWTMLGTVRNSFAWLIPVVAIASTIVAYTTLGIQSRGSWPVLGLILISGTFTSLFASRTRRSFAGFRLAQAA